MIAKENGSIFYVLFESLLALAHVCVCIECFTRENVLHHILGEETHLEILYFGEVY